jgi:hypothetical protein
VAAKVKRTWNPAHHPRDARGRFTRSSTRVMQPADRKRAAAGQAGFKPAELADGAARAEWLARESAATPSASSRISAYLDGGWRADNPALRSGKPVDGVADLDEAFTPIGEDVMLRRVVPAAMFAHIPIGDLVGMKVRDAAPASTSLDHTGPGHAGAVTMHIAAPAGTRAYVNDDAGEVLLMRDTEVAITKAVARPDGNGWDLYGALIPRKDGPARQTRPAEDDDQAAAAAAQTPAEGDREPSAGDDTAGGVGAGSGAEDGGGDGEVTTTAAPAPEATDDDKGAAAATPAAPTRASWRDHGKPATAVYHGRKAKPDAAGRRVKITQRGMGIGIADAETGDSIEGLGITAKIWLAPDPDAPDAGDQDDQDAPAAAAAPEAPAAGTSAPSDDQADDGAGEPDNGPLVAGAPRDVIAAAVGRQRFNDLRGQGLADLADGLTPDEKRAVWDALIGDPLDHDRYIAALGAPRYNGIYQAAIMPSTRDQDREAVFRAALARELTAEEKAAVEATPETPPANPRDLSGAPDGSLAASVALGIRERRALGGGNSGATVELVTLEDGRQAVRKRTDEGTRFLTDLGVSPTEQQDAEELGAAVAAAFGLRVPEMVRTDDETAFFEYLPFPSGMEQLAAADDAGSLLRAWAASDDGKRMGAADVVIGNPDRNAGNFLVDGETLPVLDHSLAFDYGGEDPARPWLDKVGRDWFTEHYVRRAGTGDHEWRDSNPLTPADVAELKQRLVELAPMFAERDRRDWHVAAMTRLVQLGEHAGGTRNLIAPAGDDEQDAGDAEATTAGTGTPDADQPDVTDATTAAASTSPAGDTETPAAGGARIPAEDGRKPNPREDPAGWAAASTDAELEKTAGTRGVLPRVRKAIAEEQRLRSLSPDEMAAEQRLDAAVSNPARGNFAELGLKSGDRVIFFGTKTRDPKARGEVARLELSGGRNPHVMVRGEGDDSTLLMRLDAKSDRFWAAPVDAPETGDAGAPADTTPDAPAAAGDDTAATAGTSAPDTEPAAAEPAEPGSDRALGELAMASIQTHTDDEFAALDAGADLARGDLVVIKSFNRWRTGVVTGVSRGGRVEALVATPSSPDRVYGARGKLGEQVRLLRKGEAPGDLPPAEDGTPVADLDTTAPDLVDAPADTPAAPAAGPGTPGSDTADLAAAVASGEAAVQTLTGGANAKVELVTYQDGTLAVRKRPVPNENDPTPADQQADAEELSALVYGALGANVPRVLRTGPEELVQDYKPGRSGGDYAPDDRGPFAATDSGLLLGLGDILIANQDRHTNNWQVDDAGEVIGIDHALAYEFNQKIVDGDFVDEEPDGAPTMPGGIFAARFLVPYEQRRSAGSDGWADHDFTPADMALVRARLVALQPKFAELGRDGWHKMMMARLDQVEPHAKGTRNRIAGEAPAAPAAGEVPQAPPARAKMDDEQYRRDYDRGWRTSKTGGADSLERGDARGEPEAWYDGWSDYSVDRPKWDTPRKDDAEERARVAGEPLYALVSYNAAGEASGFEIVRGRERLEMAWAEDHLEPAQRTLDDDGRGTATRRIGRIEWGPVAEDQAYLLGNGPMPAGRGVPEFLPRTSGDDSAETPAAGTSAPETPATTDDRVVSAVEELIARDGGRAGDLVSLARIRDELSDVDPAEVTAALLRLDRARVLQLDPDPDRRNLTDRARAAAVSLGGEDMHLVSLVQPIADEPEPAAAGTELASLPAGDQARIRHAVAEHAAKLYANPMIRGNRDDVARYLSEGELTAVTDRHGLKTMWAAVSQAIDADPDALTRTEADITARREQRQAEAARLSSEAAAAMKAGDPDRALDLIDAGEQADPEFTTGRGRGWESLRTLVADRRAAAAAAQPATSQNDTTQTPPAAAAPAPDADPFAAMLTRVPKTVSRAETGDGTRAGAAEVDIFGNVTAFVPARREAIGLSDRPDVGRTRAIAAAQQLSMLDQTEAAGGGLGGGEAALFGLFDMPPADPPPAAVPAAAPAGEPDGFPDAPDSDLREALAGRVLAEDLTSWTDEQLNGAFFDLSAGAELTDQQGEALRRIEGLWEAREQAMRDVVAGIPDDLTTLDDDEAVALLMRLTSTHGTMDDAAVARVNADLDRREAEATEGARASAELMERAYADPSGFTTEDEWNARHEAATALGDWDQVDNNLAAWTAWEQAEADRVLLAQQEADRIEAERMEALRIEREATAAREAAAAAEAERARTEQAMIAARAAAVIPPTEDSAVRSAHQALGEDETRRVLGAEKYDAILERVAGSPLDTDDARRFAIRAQLLNLDENDKVRLVMAAAEMQTPDDIRAMDDTALMMETLIGGVPEAGETADQAAVRLERQRMVNAEQNRRGMARLVAEGREQFATYRSRVLVAPLSELSDAELAAAPGIFVGDPDAQLFGKLAEIRAEADRRRAEAEARAAAKAAGPTAPARLHNPVAALGSAERMLENYGRNFQYARDGQARLLSARALTVGLPADATEADVKKAERGDERSHYERAGWTIAWYRHLGQFAEMTDQERQLDWLTGPDDDPDVPDVVMPLPGAKVPKPAEAWEAMKQQAIYDRRAGIQDGAYRYTMALARSYGIPFDPADRTEDAMRKLGSANQDAMRNDPRTAAQQAASFIAEWRRLAAEDGVDPSNALLYGPPDRRPKNVPRTQWTPTADEAIRVDRLVAGGRDYDEAYAEVMGIDPDEMRRAQAAMAVTGVMRPSDRMIRDHYADFVYRQEQDAEAATNGYLLNKAGKAAGVDPSSLFSGDPDRAYRYASEELLRFWGEPGNERKTYSEYKAELVGDTAAAQRRRAASSKGNQFA